MAGAGFLALHAMLHAAMMIGAILGLCTVRTWAFDIAAVIVPSLLALLVAFPGEGERHA